MQEVRPYNQNYFLITTMTTKDPPRTRKEKPWVLTYTLKAMNASHNEVLRNVTYRKNYPTRESAVQGLEAIQSGASMWRNDIWELKEWKITDKRV